MLPIDQKDIFSTKEAADYLNYSEATLELWRKNGTGPKYSKPMHKVYYFKADLDEWIRGNNERV